jgi:hypothetical protein
MRESTWSLSDIESYVVSETHHGKPGLKASKKDALARELRPAAEAWFPILRVSTVSGARQVAAQLAGYLWPDHPEITASVWTLADDPDWEVREWAVGPFVALGVAQVEAWASFRDWAERGSDGVKRALAVALKHAAHSGRVDAAPILQVADALAMSESEYVRKNLGPFGIGDGVLPCFPHETLVHLDAWAHSAAWPARWNAAAVFTAKKARPWGDSARAFLATLAGDRDVEVSRIARRALSRVVPPPV